MNDEILLNFLRLQKVEDFIARAQMPPNENIHALADSIRTNRHTRGCYAGLTDAMLERLIEELREEFYDLEGADIEIWNNPAAINRIAEAHIWVKNRLIEELNLSNSSWGIVGQIINHVFGNIPVISYGLKKELHKAGYLCIMTTNDIRKLLQSLHNFYMANRDILQDIANRMSNLMLDRVINELPLPIPVKIVLSAILTYLHEFLYDEWNNQNNQ